jgi:uncharacterized protein (TIGR03437 family)
VNTRSIRNFIALFSVSSLSLLVLINAAASLSPSAGSSALDPFIVQITNDDKDTTPAADDDDDDDDDDDADADDAARPSYAGGISGDGRFVVIQSRGNIATFNPDNADENSEIFLYDYAQRQIFQITHTRSALKATDDDPNDNDDDNDKEDPDDGDNDDDDDDVAVEVSNHDPVISYDGRYIAFTSNAANPGSFDGNEAQNRTQLAADGNQEIFLYRIPDVPAADLKSGTVAPFVDLSAGSFIRITDTPASIRPQPGAAHTPPVIAYDNLFVTVNDDASVIAFSSNRNFATANGLTNADANQEIFVFDRRTGTMIQVTDTQNATPQIHSPFSTNPVISGDGSTIAFISNGNLPDVATGQASNSDGNVEIFLATLSGNAVGRIRQVTKTTAKDQFTTVNFLGAGRCLSRDGNYIAFESTADLDTDAKIQNFRTVFLYNVSSNTFTRVGPRPESSSDIERAPVFTGDGTTLIFASALNFNADGSQPATDTDGLNPDKKAQLFAAAVAAPSSFVRLTKTPASSSGAALLHANAGSDLRRIALSMSNVEIGGKNPDGAFEMFYMLVPPVTSETPASANAVAFQTGASLRDVIAAPSPSPTPTPPAVGTFAPGMLGIARSSQPLAPSERSATSAELRPALPIELNGVSVAIDGAAAGLYFVGPSQINFVVPQGLAPSAADKTYDVVINNNGAVIRSAMRISSAQPDIFTSANGPGGRLVVFNVTNPLAAMPEPFTVKSANDKGETVATVLRVILTGVSNAQKSQVTVRVKDVDITGDAILFVGPTRTPGFDQIDFQLPESLDKAGDVPVVITVSASDATVTSRPADGGAGNILIN